MNAITLRLPSDMREWIDAKVASGEFESPEDYLWELIERDRETRSDEERIEEIRNMVAEARIGAVSTRTTADRIAEGESRLRERGLVRD